MAASEGKGKHDEDEGCEDDGGVSVSGDGDDDNNDDDDSGGGSGGCCRRVSRPPRGIVAGRKVDKRTGDNETTRDKERARKWRRETDEEKERERGRYGEAERETRGYARLFGPILWGGNENAQGTRKRDHHLRVAG